MTLRRKAVLAAYTDARHWCMEELAKLAEDDVVARRAVLLEYAKRASKGVRKAKRNNPPGTK